MLTTEWISAPGVLEIGRLTAVWMHGDDCLVVGSRCGDVGVE